MPPSKAHHLPAGLAASLSSHQPHQSVPPGPGSESVPVSLSVSVSACGSGTLSPGLLACQTPRGATGLLQLPQNPADGDPATAAAALASAADVVGRLGLSLGLGPARLPVPLAGLSGCPGQPTSTTIVVSPGCLDGQAVSPSPFPMAAGNSIVAGLPGRLHTHSHHVHPLVHGLSHTPHMLQHHTTPPPFQHLSLPPSSAPPAPPAPTTSGLPGFLAMTTGADSQSSPAGLASPMLTGACDLGLMGLGLTGV
ncbi:unnamed protein product, partial [Protopolystoma xenopodis]